MKIINSIKEWKMIRKTNLKDKSLGFVPTMGCLHQGHVSLMERSAQENDVTAISIFVNPTQFNDPSDFQLYPRTIEADCEKAHKAKVDYAIIPSAEEMYPENNYIRYTTDHPDFMKLEGHFRPGHFDGVLTVVMKLLMIVNPTRVYFGEKDYQQYMLIKKLIENYFIDIEIVPCKTIRETSGLPMSSRNTRLSQDERGILEDFYQKLFSLKEISSQNIKDLLHKKNMQYEYVEEFYERIFFALRVGKIRIIDNI